MPDIIATACSSAMPMSICCEPASLRFAAVNPPAAGVPAVTAISVGSSFISRSLQEYAENSEDDDIRQYTKTLDEETAAAKQVRDVLRALECLPSDEAEMRELARCYMDWSVRRDETREDAQNTILRAQRKLDALAEQFGMGPKLKVVK